MVEKICILGSTGSIGEKAVKVAKNLNIKVEGIAAYGNTELLEKQIRELKPKIACLYDYERASKLKERVKDVSVKVVSGKEGLCEVAGYKSSEMLLNAVVGIVGLEPTLEAIKARKDVALANKETLVAGGKLVMEKASEYGVNIIPVDSEHSAILQCLRGENKESIKKILLTASGGPFFNKKTYDLRNVTKEQALKHPNWSMGEKNTIDSATMMNKGLEIIEAAWMFGLSCEQIEVVIHRESIIHSMVEYKDNSVIAQLGVPDMSLPIQYALTYPERVESLAKQLDLMKLNKLTFFKPDYETFKCLRASITALKKGGLYATVLNGANEEAVKLFLEDKICFLQIGELVEEAVNRQENHEDNITLDKIIKANNKAKEFVRSRLNIT